MSVAQATSTLPVPQENREPPSGSSLFLTPEWFDLLAQYGLSSVGQRCDVSPHAHLVLPMTRSGSRFHSLSNYYSGEYGLVDGSIPSGAEALQLARLLRDAGARHIELRPLREDREILRVLMSALRGSAYFCDTYHVTTNWYLPCAGLRWNDYLASRPSRLVNTLRRCRKRLAEKEGFRLDIVTEPATLPPALGAYMRVYAASWKEAEPYPEFIPRLCRLAADHGWLRLGVLYLDNEPAAAQIWFVKDETASIYKLAYDARFAKLGVGTVLTAALAERVLDVDKVREIDFLTGDDAYKAEWMTHSRELVGFIAYDLRNPSGLLKAGYQASRKWLRSIFTKAKR